MTSSVERFWNSVGRWREDHVRVLVEFARLSSPYEVWTLEGTVSPAERGTLVTFRSDNGEEKAVEFGSVEDIRAVSFNPLEGVDCFRAVWPDGAQCTVTEVLIFGKPV